MNLPPSFSDIFEMAESSPETASSGLCTPCLDPCLSALTTWAERLPQHQREQDRQEKGTYSVPATVPG